MKYFKYLLSTLFVIVLAIPYFMRLDVQPIRQWDEARMAVNALEMSQTNNIWVTTFQNEPDMWSTKPPLMIWIQAISIKILGPNELAVRLPAAIAAFLTMLLISFWVQKVTKDNISWLWSAIALSFAPGFLGLHTGRTGDFDALLTLFITIAAFSTHMYTSSGMHQKWLFALSLALTGAVLSKGIAGAIIIPILVIWVVAKGAFYKIVKNKYSYVALSIPIVIIVSFYLLREHYNPGFISRVWENEIGGRYTTAIEGHYESTWFYLENLINERFEGFIWISLCGSILGLFYKPTRDITLFALLLGSWYFIIITSAETKLFWYDMPLFPFLALLSGIVSVGILLLLQSLSNSFLTLRISYILSVTLITTSSFSFAQKQLVRIYHSAEFDWDKNFYNISYYLRDKDCSKDKIASGKVIHKDITEASAFIYFYTTTLTGKGCNFRLHNQLQLQAGDTIIAHTKEDYLNIENNAFFSSKLIDEAHNTKAYLILPQHATGQ